jgi:hypothetical protein
VRYSRINTASPCRLLLFVVGTLHFDYGNGMEEVVGSNPTRSTKHIASFKAKSFPATVQR